MGAGRKEKEMQIDNGVGVGRTEEKQTDDRQRNWLRFNSRKRFGSFHFLAEKWLKLKNTTWQHFQAFKAESISISVQILASLSYLVEGSIEKTSRTLDSSFSLSS
jgi:hypothetical protein